MLPLLYDTPYHLRYHNGSAEGGLTGHARGKRMSEDTDRRFPQMIRDLREQFTVHVAVNLASLTSGRRAQLVRQPLLGLDLPLVVTVAAQGVALVLFLEGLLLEFQDGGHPVMLSP